MEERKLREIQVGTEDIFEGVILNVKRDQVQLPNGHQSVREVIRHVGAVCVVPVTADGITQRRKMNKIPTLREDGPYGRIIRFILKQRGFQDGRKKTERNTGWNRRYL